MKNPLSPLLVCCSLALSLVFGGSGLSFAQDTKPAATTPAPAKAAPTKPTDAKAAPPTTDGKSEAPKSASVNEAMGSMVELTKEVSEIDKRLGLVEKSVADIAKSVAEISKSLLPVGVLTRPEGTTALLTQVGDLIADKARTLILLVLGGLAVLIVLAAVLLRWALAGLRRDPILPARAGSL